MICACENITDCRDYYILPSDKGLATIEKTKKGFFIEFMTDNEDISRIKVNYCPLCGRKLK